MKDLTIIVPVYNVEKYIATCLQSILKTNWQEISYEIVVVDDESPDQSMKIVSEIAAAHPQIKTVSQKNKGLGGARNTGIALAEGQYIFFLDSDDYLVDDQLPVLVDEALKSNLDILEFGAVKIDVHGKTIDEIFVNHPTGVLGAVQYLSTVNFANSACNKLYRKDFLEHENILFFEKTWIEDAPFNIEAISKAGRIKAVDKIPVAYLQNPNSITREKRSLSAQHKFIADSIKVTAHMDRYSDYHKEKTANLKIQARVADFVAGMLLSIIKSDLTLEDKAHYVFQLKDLHLYPCTYRPNFFMRNILIKIFNHGIFLKLAGIKI